MKHTLKLITAAILLAQQTSLYAQNETEEQDLISRGSEVNEQPQRPAPGLENPEITEIVTLGRFIPDEKRSTAAISNVIDAEAFQRAGDTNVADGLKRVKCS